MSGLKGYVSKSYHGVERVECVLNLPNVPGLIPSTMNRKLLEFSCISDVRMLISYRAGVKGHREREGLSGRNVTTVSSLFCVYLISIWIR